MDVTRSLAERARGVNHFGHSQPQTTYRYLSADAETAAQAATILDAYQKQVGDPVEASEAVN